MLDVLLWYLLIQVTGMIGFVIIFKFLPNLPDRGYGFSKPFGLLIWSYIFWLLGSLQIIKNNPQGIFFSVLVFVGVATWLFSKQKDDLFGWIKNHKQAIITGEVIFLLAFLIMVFMRATNPEISGTEKPMEMAFINAILRSENFPPFDPWLSGYAISYYYFGYVMVALLTKITGILPTVAFNLAVSLWFAMTAFGAHSILYALLYHWKKKKEGREKASSLGLSVSWLGPLFILIVSNLEGFLQALHKTGYSFLIPNGGDGTDFWTWLNIQEINKPAAAPYSFNPLNAGWWFWRASRVVQDFNFADPHFKNYIEVIDEFPFFTFYLADLHPHVLAMPFVLMVVGLALNLYFTRNLFISGEGIISWIKRLINKQKPAIGEMRIIEAIRKPEFWMFALVLGGLAFLNTWDFPIYTGLVGLVVIFIGYEKRGWNWGLVELFLETVIILGIIGTFLYIPFFAGFASQAGGFLPSLIFFTRGTFFWVMFGSLLVPITVWIIWKWFHQGREGFPWQGLRFSAMVVFGLWLAMYILSIMISLAPNFGDIFLDGVQGAGGANVMFVIAESFTRRITNFGTWITFIVLITFLVELIPWVSKSINKEVKETISINIEENNNIEKEPTVDIFVIILIIMGILLTLTPEFFYLRDNFGTRMNTIFKFYFQAWIIWGLAASYCFIVLWSQKGKIKAFFAPISLIVIAASLVYPAAGFIERINTLMNNPVTLDGAEYIHKWAPDEGKAILWLRNAPLGVIAEAVGGQYSDFGRLSTFSGQPTVLGWPGHENQWRGGNEEMGSRQKDIEILYKTNRWQEASAILDRYQIKYVIVGTREKESYQANSVKFQGHLMQVYQTESLVIFQVPYVENSVSKIENQ